VPLEKPRLIDGECDPHFYAMVRKRIDQLSGSAQNKFLVTISAKACNLGLAILGNPELVPTPDELKMAAMLSPDAVATRCGAWLDKAVK
jgi:hypothetical protein